MRHCTQSHIVYVSLIFCTRQLAGKFLSEYARMDDFSFPRDIHIVFIQNVLFICILYIMYINSLNCKQNSTYIRMFRSVV